MSTLEDYADRYPNVHAHREEGVLVLRLHTNDGPLRWGDRIHHDLGELFEFINHDLENRVVILTGTGDDFCAGVDLDDFMRQAVIDQRDFSVRLYRDGARMLRNFVNLEIPVIAIVTGAVVTHSELPVLADVVIASESVEFRDASHWAQGIPPADGMQIVWTELIGINRARHFLLTGRAIGATEALELGVVNEVLPESELMARAQDLAKQWAARPLWALQGTKAALNKPWRRLFAEDLHAGLAYEFLANVASMGQ